MPLSLIISLTFWVDVLYAQQEINLTNLKLDSTKINQLENCVKTIYNRNPELGIKQLDTLCSYYKQTGKTNEYYIAKVKIGHCYNTIQRNYLAISIYEDCAKYFNEKNDSLHLFHVYTGIGNVYFILKNYSKAKYFYELGLNICNEKQIPHQKFTAYQNFVNSLIEFKKYDSAVILLKKSAALLPYIKYPEYPYRLHTNFAYLYSKMNKHQLALDETFIALPYYQKNNLNLNNKMRLFEIAGLSYLELKNYSLARIYFDSANNINKSFNSTYNSYDLLNDYMRIDTATKNHKSAVINLLTMLQLKDTLYANDQANLTSDLLIKYETEKKETEKNILEKENNERKNIIFWQRILMLAIAVLFTITFVLVYLFFKNKAKQQKVISEKEKAESELKALKAQLNPHFIQNIFQIIANQVAANPADVTSFLQKTSNYFRIVLNGTEKESQSLEDEISFTEKYLGFQQSLFSDKLSFEINIDSNVDAFDTIVPTMILQPFIENSIKYGLQLNQQSLHIKINIHNVNQYLRIDIEDNGNNINNADIGNKKSFGNKLIAKRLLLFYNNKENKPILNSYNLDNNLGYKVELLLPMS